MVAEVAVLLVVGVVEVSVVVAVATAVRMGVVGTVEALLEQDIVVDSEEDVVHLVVTHHIEVVAGTRRFGRMLLGRSRRSQPRESRNISQRWVCTSRLGHISSYPEPTEH